MLCLKSQQFLLFTTFVLVSSTFFSLCHGDPQFQHLPTKHVHGNYYLFFFYCFSTCLSPSLAKWDLFSFLFWSTTSLKINFTTLLFVFHASNKTLMDLICIYGGENGVADISGRMRRSFLEESNTEVAPNATLILAANKTHRIDPFANFTYYEGGWNITNEHYLYVSSFRSLFHMLPNLFYCHAISLYILACHSFVIGMDKF